MDNAAHDSGTDDKAPDALSGRIHLITGENLEPGRSFMELLYQVPDTYDYYAFSDQDDVWLEDKLISGIRSTGTAQGIIRGESDVRGRGIESNRLQEQKRAGYFPLRDYVGKQGDRLHDDFLQALLSLQFSPYFNFLSVNSAVFCVNSLFSKPTYSLIVSISMDLLG